MFLGSQLEDVIDQLVKTGAATESIQGGTFTTGVSALPDFVVDATDRNRTSPFAFTGNKFEFRMVGSSDSVAEPNVVLNTIVAEAFDEACTELENAENFEMALHDLIKKYAREHRRIIFNGNGYAQEWVEEAERRGLPNLPTMVDSIPALTTEKSVSMFEKYNVYTKTELESRAEISYEIYAKAINIEAKTMIDMAGKQIIPAVVKYSTTLADSINSIKTACPEADVETQQELLKITSEHLKETSRVLKILKDESEKALTIKNMKERAIYYKDNITKAMDDLRKPVDELEMIVSKDMWPMPSYGDLIFEV